jgi:alkylation response protein AidB-like acyl-CoA dehydrogenase
VDLRPDPVLEHLVRQAGTRLDAVRRGGDASAARAALRDLNAFAMAAPVEADGFDLGLGYAAMICAELGRRALPEVYGGPLLVLDALAPLDAERAKTLAHGDVPVAAAGIDAGTDYHLTAAHAGAARLDRTQSGFALSGGAVFEDPGEEEPPAALCCLPALAPAGVSEHGETLRLVLITAPQWRPRTAPASDGSLRLAADGLAVPETEVLGVLGTGRPLTDPQALLARARVRQAGYLLGLGEGAHALAVDYAARRRQFGRAVLDNQAVSLPLAQTRIQLAATRLTVRQAGWLADAGQPFALEAAQALAAAAETALSVVRQAVQVHGARGLSLEYPIHAYHRPVRLAATRYGSASALWREAGARRLAAASRTPVPAAASAVRTAQS